jgi:short subunit dehydrogenase-like uncharacterized protein
VITLFGATGYTGRLVARALERQGLPFRIAGRSPDKLAALADSLWTESTSSRWLVADATRPETLPPLCEDTHVLVNCVGPFTALGEPVVVQAALNGVHYLDTTNELGYVYRMRGYDALARQNGAAIVPACGFEVALADCAAAVLASGVGAHPALDEVSVVYDIRGKGSSFGSRRSAVQALATSWIGYRQGGWTHAVPCREGRRVQGPGGLQAALSFPSGEIVTVPSHVPVSQVTTWLTVSWHALFWAPALIPIFAWLARGPVGRLVEVGISGIFPPPQTGMRSRDPFAVRVEARRGVVRRWLTLTGQGVYDLTAQIVAYAAGQLMQPDYNRAGVLAPAAALDPQALLDHAVARWGVAVSPGEQNG